MAQFAIRISGAVLSLSVACVLGLGSALASQSDCTDLNSRFQEVKKSATEQKLNSLLLDSSAKGCVDVAQTLLENGASAMARGAAGQTALHFAAKAGEADVVSLLLSKGADIEQRDLKGATPLFLAAEAKQKKVVKLLLEHGAQAEAPGRSGTTPLAAAAFNGDTESVRLLLAAKADINAPDVSGKSPVIYAAARGFAPIVQLFLDKGIKINARYEHDLTLLMWASGHANDVPADDGVALVKMILDHGATLDDVDDRGKTALMMAAELGHPEVVKELIARGANQSLKDKNGKSALDSAADDATRAAFTGH